MRRGIRLSSPQDAVGFPRFRRRCQDRIEQMLPREVARIVNPFVYNPFHTFLCVEAERCTGGGSGGMADGNDRRSESGFLQLCRHVVLKGRRKRSHPFPGGAPVPPGTYVPEP